MPEIFLATDSSAAKRLTESRPKGPPAPPQAESSPGPDSFSRTLQTQMDERRVGERRAAKEHAQAGDSRAMGSEQASARSDRTNDGGATPRSDSAKGPEAEDGLPAEEARIEAEQPDSSTDAQIVAAPLPIALPAANAVAGKTGPAPIAGVGMSGPPADGTDALAQKQAAVTMSSPDGDAGTGTGAEAESDSANPQRGNDRAQPSPNIHATTNRAPQSPATPPTAADDNASESAARPEVGAIRASLRPAPEAAAIRSADTPMPQLGDLAGRGGERSVELQQQLGTPHSPIQAAVRTVASPNTPPPTAFVSTPAGHPGFADEVGQRVVLFAGRGESKAELILTPPQLGRVEVSLTVSAEQATAQFVANSQSARDALEQALPRLREMLAEAGIQLGQSSVGTRSEQQAGDGRQAAHYDTGEHLSDSSEGLAGSVRPWTRTAVGLIDTFA